MDVILLDKTPNGNVGDKISVKAGFARNYLIPFGKAVMATPANLAAFEARRSELEKKAQDKLEAAQKRAEALAQANITIKAMASDEGKLYGSVGTIEIVEALKEAGHEVEKREVVLPEGTIHEIGEFDVTLQLHADVSTAIHIEIAPEK